MRLPLTIVSVLAAAGCLSLALTACTNDPGPTPGGGADMAPEQTPPHAAAHLADVTVPGWSPTDLDTALGYLDDRGAWEDHGRRLDVPRHPAEKYLDHWVIVLDPGHGGMAGVAGYKRGPTGVREAEMNLRVAFLLRKLLTDAGAHVILTREDETSEAANDTLDDTHLRRANIANLAQRPDGGVGADLFISLHHNAASGPTANYTSVWFHGEADWAEPSLDPARYVGHQLGAELRMHDVGRTGILMSDRQMYADGFAVLRHARVPAFLVEASFFTHPEEEQRLRDAVYNLREAYAIYLGLVEYAYGGRPTQSVPAVEQVGSTLRISTTLSEGLPAWWGHDRQRTLSSTIAVYADGERIDASFDPETKHLTASIPWDGEDPQPIELSIHHANLYKHHNWPQRYTVTWGDDGQATVEPRRQSYAEE